MYPNTLEWFSIMFWRLIGIQGIYSWTSNEHNYAITPCCPFISNFFMLLDLITSYDFPRIPLSSIYFPFEENLKEIFWKSSFIVPNDYSHLTHITKLEPPIWIAIIGLSNKYSLIVRLILWHFHKKLWNLHTQSLLEMVLDIQSNWEVWIFFNLWSYGYY